MGGLRAFRERKEFSGSVPKVLTLSWVAAGCIHKKQRNAFLAAGPLARGRTKGRIYWKPLQDQRVAASAFGWFAQTDWTRMKTRTGARSDSAAPAPVQEGFWTLAPRGNLSLWQDATSPRRVRHAARKFQGRLPVSDVVPAAPPTTFFRARNRQRRQRTHGQRPRLRASTGASAQTKTTSEACASEVAGAGFGAQAARSLTDSVGAGGVMLVETIWPSRAALRRVACSLMTSAAT